GDGGDGDAPSCPSGGCEDTTCATFPCEDGEICEETATGPSCMDQDGCVGTVCEPGFVCVDALAPATGYECVDEDGCAGAVCASDEECVDLAPPETGHRCDPVYQVLWKLVPQSAGRFD